ncbi:putative treslin [Sesbania bispinosa]|nr:putative treslin [Sesbania bispinosa]
MEAFPLPNRSTARHLRCTAARGQSLLAAAGMCVLLQPSPSVVAVVPVAMQGHHHPCAVPPPSRAQPRVTVVPLPCCSTARLCTSMGAAAVSPFGSPSPKWKLETLAETLCL